MTGGTCLSVRIAIDVSWCQQVKSTYSDCFALDGSTDRMDQLPYYCVVEKLEKQNSCLLAEQQNFRQQLVEQMSNMNGLSGEIQV